MNDLLFLHSISQPQGYYSNLFFEQSIRVIPFFINDTLKISLFISDKPTLVMGQNFDKKISLLDFIKKHFKRKSKTVDFDLEINKIFSELSKFDYREFDIIVWGESCLLGKFLYERLISLKFKINIRGYGCYPLVDNIKYYSLEDDYISLIPNLFYKQEIFTYNDKVLKKPNLFHWLMKYNENLENHTIEKYQVEFLRNKL